MYYLLNRLIGICVGLVADTFPKLAVALLIKRLLSPKGWVNWFSLAITTILILTNIVAVILVFVSASASSGRTALTY